MEMKYQAWVKSRETHRTAPGVEGSDTETILNAAFELLKYQQEDVDIYRVDDDGTETRVGEIIVNWFEGE